MAYKINMPSHNLGTHLPVVNNTEPFQHLPESFAGVFITLFTTLEIPGQEVARGNPAHPRQRSLVNFLAAILKNHNK